MNRTRLASYLVLVDKARAQVDSAKQAYVVVIGGGPSSHELDTALARFQVAQHAYLTALELLATQVREQVSS